MKALVTGASGFLGHELVKQLCDAEVEVVAVVGPPQNELEIQRIASLRRMQVRTIASDLRHEAPLEEVPENWDMLFHLAAYVRTELDSEDVRINDLGTARLFRQISVANKKVIYTSTIAVADNAPDGCVTLDANCEPRTAYGRTKLATEAIVSNECRSKSAEFTIVRLPTLYGIGYRPGGMFDVLPKQLAANNPLARLMWPGKMALLAVEDAATLILRAATSEFTWGRTFHGSSNENPTTWEIAEAIAAATHIRYAGLGLPKPVTSLLRSVLGDWWQASFLPHPIQVSAWRAHLLINGLHCDGSEMNQLLGLTCQKWRPGFEKMYAHYPRRSVSADAQ